MSKKTQTRNRCLVSTDSTDVTDVKSPDVRQHDPSFSVGSALFGAQWIDGRIWSYGRNYDRMPFGTGRLTLSFRNSA